MIRAIIQSYPFRKLRFNLGYVGRGQKYLDCSPDAYGRVLRASFMDANYTGSGNVLANPVCSNWWSI
jgi:hypothetical protein